MIKNNIFSALVVFVTFASGCATQVKSNNSSAVKSVSFDQIEQIGLGQSQEQVIKFLGVPQSKQDFESKGKPFIRFEYVNVDQNLSQRAAMVFDSSDKKVSAKTFIPTEGDFANSLNDLISEKYKNSKFIYYMKPRCKDHSASAESIAINLDQGILINYIKADFGVLAISWMEQYELSDIVRKLELCQKSQAQPK
jgi:outer membrane protein assembly factor BamE (lipoprotein component of BamABCDE complex)